MGVVVLEQSPLEPSGHPLDAAGGRSLGPSGGARTNGVAGGTQDSSGSSSMPKECRNIFNTSNNWDFACVCWLNISRTKE